jgi:hypothetical protein
MAMNKYKRTNFYVQEEVDGILENDLVNNYWDLFRIKREMSTFTIGRTYIARPDLIALKTLGDQNLWWIILKCNPEICDPWNDLEIGSILYIPDIRDVNDWVSLKDQKKRK